MAFADEGSGAHGTDRLACTMVYDLDQSVVPELREAPQRCAQACLSFLPPFSLQLQAVRGYSQASHMIMMHNAQYACMKIFHG